jgi:hypothetical protein
MQILRRLRLLRMTALARFFNNLLITIHSFYAGICGSGNPVGEKIISEIAFTCRAP